MEPSNKSNNKKSLAAALVAGWWNVPPVFMYVEGSSVYNGRACGVKLCSLAPVTVSDHVIIKASSEVLGQRAVQSQLGSLFKLF